MIPGDAGIPNDAGQVGFEQDERIGRFRASIGGREVAVLDYLDTPGSWDLIHTFAQPELRGTGVASRLVEFAMNAARAAGRTIVPSCPYIPVWLSRHPEFADLVAPGSADRLQR